MTTKLNLQQLVNALLSTLISGSKKGKKCDITIAEIDEIERKVQIAASVLRGLRNSLQPINRLPPELLAEIFNGTKQNLPPFLPLVKGGIRCFDNHSWLSLIHVCRHWRGVVASYPTLWGTIDNLRGGVKPEVSLKRSRSAPLDVFLSITGPEFASISPELLETLIPHIPRFRQFHMNTDGWFSNTPIYQSLNHPAPNLTSLSIVTKGRDVVGGALPSIFADDMPSLRQLTLEHFTSWPSTYFTHLTHLCLFDQWNENPTSRPTTAEFLDFLESSPQLEELAIVRAGPTRLDIDDFPTVQPPDRQVSLAHLRELSLGDWPSTRSLARLLSHLTLPPTTQMFIWGQGFPSLGTGGGGGGDEEEPQDLASWLPQDITHLGPIQNLKEIWITRMPDTWARGECPFVAILNDTLYLWGFYTTMEIRPLAAGKIPLGTVERLQLRDCFPHPERMTDPMWREFFEKMERLESLTILARDCPVVTRTVLGTLYPKKTAAPPGVGNLNASVDNRGVSTSRSREKMMAACRHSSASSASPLGSAEKRPPDVEPVPVGDSLPALAGPSTSSSISQAALPAAGPSTSTAVDPSSSPGGVPPSTSTSSSKRMTFSKGSRKHLLLGPRAGGGTLKDEDKDVLLCPRLANIRIEDNPHIPTLFVSSLAKTRARRGSPIKRLEVLYFDPMLNRPPRSSTRSSRSSLRGADPSDPEVDGLSEGSVHGTDDDDDDDGIDGEYRGFTEADYRLLSKYIDEVVVDISKEKLADVGPPQWPNQAFRWTLPTRLPP